MNSKKNLDRVAATSFFTLLLVFLFLAGGTFNYTEAAARSAQSNLAPGEVIIFLYGQELFLDVPPLIEEGRTLVPARFLLEAMGAEVQWDPLQKKVSVSMDEKYLELAVGEKAARLNGKPVPLHVPARLIKGRTFVPLRFVSEALGADVLWDGEKRIIYLEMPSAGEDFGPKGLSHYYSDLGVEVETYGIFLGDTVEKVQELLGEPEREDHTIYGYSWWVYNRDAHNYLQLAVRDGRVVAIYSNGEQWSFGPVNSGSKLEELEGAFETSDSLFVEEIKTVYKLYLPMLVYNNLVATFYSDAQDGDKIVGMRLEDRGVAEDRFMLFYRYRSSQGPRETCNLQQLREAEIGEERQILDLANVERLKRGLPALEWHDAVALAALGHSTEMFIHDYFSHYSAISGKGPDHRLDEQGVDFSLAAENIARGQMDGVEVHHGLMNSPGHRENILKKELRALGVGVYRDCYTQIFVTERE